MGLNSIRQCRRCKKLFQYSGNPMCRDCIIEMDRDFERVRNYMYDNPKASIDKICEETEVDRDEIRQWLREGRLLLSNDNVPLLECESCGAPVMLGRYCDKCANVVKTQLDSTVRDFSSSRPAEKSKPEDKGGPRMHIDSMKRR